MRSPTGRQFARVHPAGRGQRGICRCRSSIVSPTSIPRSPPGGAISMPIRSSSTTSTARPPRSPSGSRRSVATRWCPGIGRTGVVGVIRGNREGARKVIGLRADMDALPLEEAAIFPTSPPCPARCTPAAMTATPRCSWAPRSTRRDPQFAGTAVVIFQPAEEGGAGGRPWSRTA